MNGVRIGDYGHGVEFGVFITPAAESADEVVAWSELSEGAGYDLVTFNDHPLWRPAASPTRSGAY